MAARPSGIGTVDELVHRLRRLVVAQQVASHVRRPRAAGGRVHPDAHGVAQPDHPRSQLAVLDDLHRGAALVLLVADVAGRADGQQQTAVGQHRHGLGAVAAGREPAGHGPPIRLLEAVEHDLVQGGLAGHEQPPILGQRDVVGRSVAGADLDDLVGHTVRIGVRQRHDAVRTALCDEQRAVGRDRHEARACEGPRRRPTPESRPAGEARRGLPHPASKFTPMNGASSGRRIQPTPKSSANAPIANRARFRTRRIGGC